MILQRTILKETINIESIFTLYYFEFNKNYVFSGERHNFWEFLYVDKGEVEVMADTTIHKLKQGTIIFHKPNEFHSFYAYHGTAPNLIVLTFDCQSFAMTHFENQVIQLEDEERNLLAQIIKEGANAFEFPFLYPLQRKKHPTLGCEQLLKNYLETFLIRLVRKQTLPGTSSLSTPAKEKTEDNLTKTIINFLETRLDSRVSLIEMSETTHIAKTRLKELFKKKTGSSIMEYFAQMKTEKAKTSIREGVYNFSEIARMLGFSSVHYFSKKFKRITGMSPSEYAKSVKARS